MLARLTESQVFKPFILDARPVYTKVLGSKVTRNVVSTRFGIPNLFETMRRSAHWAEWRSVGNEFRLCGGGVDRHIGFDLTAGDKEHGVHMRFFPRIRGMDTDIQSPALYVHRLGARHGDADSIYNMPATIRSAKIAGSDIIFRGEFPAEGRAFRELRIGSEDGDRRRYSFALAEEIGATPVGKPPRRTYTRSFFPVTS